MTKMQVESPHKDSSNPQASPKALVECTGTRLAFILLALCTTVFLVALDGTILATAIPTITNQFNSLSDIAWYNSAYLLTTCAFQLPFGRAYALLDSKWTFMVAVVVFEIGTAICGAAPTSFALIFGRAIAGIGGAGIFSGTFIIIAEIIPLRKRSLFAGLIGAVFAVASVIAPILGGVLTDRVSWRWCFYINLPLGAVVVVIVIMFLRLPPAKASNPTEALTFWQKAARFDPLGTLLLVPSLVCLLIALQWGGSQYSWSDSRVITLLVVFAVSIVAWAALQWWEGDNATVPWEVARQRSVAAATLYTLFGSAAFSLVVYYLPIWFQAIRSDTAEQSGIHTLAIVLSLVVSSLVAGGAVAAIGYYVPFLVLGSVCMAVGAALLMLLRPRSSTGEWIGYQIIFGAGVGMSLEQCNIAIQAALPSDKSPAGISLGVFARGLGGAVAVAVGQNVFQHSLRQGLRQTVPELGENTDELVSGATNLVSTLEMYIDNQEMISAVVSAYNHAVTRIFLVAMVLGCLTILPALAVEWRSVKEKKGDSGEKWKADDAQEKV